MKFCKPLLIVVQIILVCSMAAAQARPNGPLQPTFADGMSSAEFSRLMRDFSEEAGSFHSDNLVSNETAFLLITEKLKQLAAPGQAYIGVGPEQNFTYIAKVRPRIAFIVDIRRLAVIHHLMYKALFQMSPDRAGFISRLVSRPIIKGQAPSKEAPIGDLLAWFSSTAPDAKFQAQNLAEVRRLISRDYQVTLSETDQQQLEYLFNTFRHSGLDLTYTTRYGPTRGSFPTMRTLITQTDMNGKLGHFLTNDQDYAFVRNMHLKNLIIPLTGNFAGTKVFGLIGDYLRKNNLTVSTFYVSNVEQYLFQGGIFDAFAANVKKLPVTNNSVFIRAAVSRGPYPAVYSGHRLVTLLQRIPVFLSDFDAGRYPSYWALVSTNYIAPE